MTSEEILSIAKEATKNCVVYIFEDKINARRFLKALSNEDCKIGTGTLEIYERFRDEEITHVHLDGPATKTPRHSSIGFYNSGGYIYALLDCIEQLDKWAEREVNFALPEIKNVNMKYLLNMK